MSYINQTVPPPESGEQIAVQRLIRMSFVAGALLFGAVIWLMQNKLGGAPIQPDTPLTPLMPYLLGAALAGTIAMRIVVAKATEAQRFQYLLIGWAIGDAAALLGAVHWLMTGNPRWFFIGMFVLLGALVLHPLKRE